MRHFRGTRQAISFEWGYMANHEKFIDSSALFFSVQEIDQLLTSEERKELLDREFEDWISSLYWGEGLGIEYALKMHQLSETHEEKDEWLETYKQELDHQQRILKWMIDNNLHPTEPSFMLKIVRRIVDGGKKAKSIKEYTKVIKDGQIFLEEMGVCIIRWRLPKIKDRSLRSILYKITKDEAGHIASGKKILNKHEPYSLSKQENFLDHLDRMFPFHLGRSVLSDEKYKEIKLKSKAAILKLSTEIFKAKVYKPLEVLENFLHVEGYECFACHPTRSEGLLLEPKLINGGVEDFICLGNQFVGMNGLVHGGFISMALDEMMGYAITLGDKRFSLTTKLEMQFIAPMKCNKQYLISAKIISRDDNKIKTSGSIVDPQTNKQIAVATGDFHIVNKILGDKLFPKITNNPYVQYMFE